MDERTRAATYEDLRHVADLLEQEGVEYALIGGYALALQGIVRRWVRALSQLPGAAGELAGDETLHDEPYAIRINDEFTVDVMNSASGLSWNDLVSYRTRIDGIQVVSLVGLLRMKEHGRLKDQADAEAIRKALAGE